MSATGTLNANDDGGEESTTSSSSSSPSAEHNAVLSPLVSMPNDFRAALDAFRNDWQREIRATASSDDIALKVNKTETHIDEKSILIAEDTNSQLLAENLFQRAVELEQRGKVYDALPLYRRAVQIVPDIEFKYYEQQKAKHDTELHPNINKTSSCNDVERVDDDEIIENLQEKFEADLANGYEGRLLLSNRDAGVITTALHISDLPPELLLYILRWVISAQLDVRSLENCAAVCKGLYLCARDDEIWRLACVKVWGANVGTLESARPLPDEEVMDNTIKVSTKRYPSWRCMFIERERMLYHGCYISKSTYLRMGENSFQDQFYRPVQLVEYYRYMRFLSDGTVLMMTTADEPAVGVNKLKNIYQSRIDISRAKYFLADNLLTVIMHKPQQTTQKQQRRNNTNCEEANSTKYRLEFRIVSTPKRKFGKLIWLHYSIVTVRNNIESLIELELNKYPPLWFSPVRSYHLHTDAPLA